MDTPPETAVANQAGPRGGSAKRSNHRIGMFFVGGAGGVLAAWVTGNWVCSSFSFGLIGAFLTPFLDWLLEMANPRRGKKLEITTTLLVAGGLAVVSAVEVRRVPAEVFEKSFGLAPPAGVRNLTGKRNYAGGPGDWAAVLEFDADAATMARVVAPRAFTTRSDALSFYLDGTTDFQQVWDHEFHMAAIVEPAWKKAPSITQPRYYRWYTDKPLIMGTTVIYDAATGRTRVLHTEG